MKEIKIGVEGEGSVISMKILRVKNNLSEMNSPDQA